MNNRAKGNLQELRAQKELEASGWIVQRAGYRKFKANDFFGTWDIFALRRGNKPLFIQVKSNKISKEDRVKCEEFSKNWGHLFDCQIWIRKNYVRQWKKIALSDLSINDVLRSM